MKIDFTIATSVEEVKILNLIVNKKTGEIRATKPKHSEEDPITGRAAYVWRNVMFSVSKNPKHWCMPVTADFYLSGEDWNNRTEVIKVLNEFVDRIVNSFPKNEWHGVRRWSNALYGGGF